MSEAVQGLRDQISVIEDELQGESFEYVKVLMSPPEFDVFKEWVANAESK